jgi:hypothetical protein
VVSEVKGVEIGCRSAICGERKGIKVGWDVKSMQYNCIRVERWSEV